MLQSDRAGIQRGFRVDVVSHVIMNTAFNTEDLIGRKWLRLEFTGVIQK